LDINVGRNVCEDTNTGDWRLRSLCKDKLGLDGHKHVPKCLSGHKHWRHKHIHHKRALCLGKYKL
jgi:hypothetical protein